MNSYISGENDNTNEDSNNDFNRNLKQAIILIEEAVQGEREDQLFYEYLITQAPTQEEKDIIASIRDDEVKHNKLFRQLYKELTGKEVKSKNGEEFAQPGSYLDGIKQALFGELKAVEKYRTIYQGLNRQHHRDVLFEIITDEIKHASKYNFLYTLNRTEPTTTSREHKQNVATTDSSIPDQWLQYLQPLVTNALKEVNEGINLTHLFQEYILAGVLVGNKYSVQQAIEQVEKWEKSGESKLLQQSKKMK
ncbi:ferritin-like domain-containing protein [Neobacillus sp. PS3-40]|uniref:ferritin-like domain-containing protein n=1 Tax=Neobacillus sp. PS3-40 TaxID=3070679 RepID=UPI0027DFECF3|nr:ferritin-like domain-containing protein [Neobacillus sp. PS3-40]WML44855.1 ferritin-like domain-containing protein [Neobacillus sp. PS3-40]